MHSLIENLKGKLIVSCQAYIGEPLRHPETMAQMARACELGGAALFEHKGLRILLLLKVALRFPLLDFGKKATRVCI